MKRTTTGEVWVRRAKDIVWYAVAILGAVVMLLPFVWMVSTSFKVENEIFSMPIRWFPKAATIENYVRALEVVPILKCMLNTLIIAIPKIIGEVFVSALVAFGFARFRFKGRSFLFMAHNHQSLVLYGNVERSSGTADLHRFTTQIYDTACAGFVQLHDGRNPVGSPDGSILYGIDPCHRTPTLCAEVFYGRRKDGRREGIGK